jgi:hypothetical protein
MGARWYNPGDGDFTSADTVSARVVEHAVITAPDAAAKAATAHAAVARVEAGACPSESGAAGTTSTQVKQSLIGAGRSREGSHLR